MHNPSKQEMPSRCCLNMLNAKPASYTFQPFQSLLSGFCVWHKSSLIYPAKNPPTHPENVYFPFSNVLIILFQTKYCFDYLAQQRSLFYITFEGWGRASNIACVLVVICKVVFLYMYCYFLNSVVIGSLCGCSISK